MAETPPPDPADHAEDFAHRYEFPLDRYFALRMQKLGIPRHLFGAPDFDGDGRWRAFIAHERMGGNITTGITVNSCVLNPALLEGKESRQWAKARLRDRIDAVIAHEYEEDRLGTHELALKSAPKTALPITDGARRILKAMGRWTESRSGFWSGAWDSLRRDPHAPYQAVSFAQARSSTFRSNPSLVSR